MSEPAQVIIVGGRQIRCAAPVRTWLTTRYHFLTRMRTETRWIVNHWTGAENSAERCFQNMRDRINPLTRKPEPYSVHFIVDQMGDVYQCADADARCAHAVANGGNTYGVGIEIINRGHAPSDNKAFIRQKVTEHVHGREITYGAFYPAQIGSVIALNIALCGAYGLPVRVPMKDGEVFETVLPSGYLATFRGPLGHYNLDYGKVDPAPGLLREINSAGLRLAVG